MSDHQVVCSACRASRPSFLASTKDRPPCPECGGTTITIFVSLHDVIPPVVDSMQLELTPGSQARDWRRRWSLIQSELRQISAPKSGQMDAETIHAAAHQLHNWFIQAYHLKDALIAQSIELGVSEKQIEQAISSDPILALTADLANLDKHAKLERRPRTGVVPQIKKISGASSGSTEWRLSMRIEHGNDAHDGVQLASKIVAAWRLALTTLGCEAG